MAKSHHEIRKGLTFPGVATFPSDPTEGDQIFYAPTQRQMRYHLGTWVEISNAETTQDLQSRLANRFQLSSWRAMTTNIIGSDESSKVASSTGTLAALDYVLDSGQNLLSNQIYDAEMLAASVLPSSSEVQVFYDLANVDANPTIQLSRDGGTTLQTVPVTRSSGDDSWKGSIVFSDTEPNTTVNTYGVGNADAFRQLTATTMQSQAQSFILTQAAVVTQVTMYLNKLGTPSGNFTISIVRDASGTPSTSRGDYLISSAPQSVTAFPSGSNPATVDLPSKVVLPAGTYWLVIETDGAYKASFVSVTHALRTRSDESAPTAPGIASQFDGATWTNQTGVDLTYVVTGFNLDLRLKITSGTNGSRMRGYGVLYDKGIDATVGKSNRYEVAFDGASNPTSFDLTNSGFVPDDKLLMVMWANTGQVFVHPVFDVSGYNVTFAANQFLSSGTQRLVFWQPLGSSFDNNEKNAALLAENRLGSQTPGLDRSVSGQGIILRASNGTLVEASILFNGSNYVWQFATLPG